jgi:hypothetical protein
MFYEIDFIKVFIPKLTNLADNIVINFVENKYQYLKQNGIMLCRNDFKSAYPDFNLNIYYIFNDDLKNFTELQLRYHWHIIGNIEKQISNLNNFFELYDKYDNEFFYKTNKEMINKYYEDNYIYYFDINKNKLNKELVNIKTFHTFSKNNKNFIKSIYDFFITNPDINIEVIGLFNKDLFRTHVSKRTMKDNEIKEIIYFYLEEIEKENRETILNKEDFYNKYDKFDLDIFKKFNKKYEKVEEIICITDYHSNNLIGSLNDFLKKHIDFDLEEFKENMLDKNLSIIDNLVKFHLDENYRSEFKKYTISRDYFNIFNPEYKNIQNNEFLNLYKDRKINNLLFSDNDFKIKYPLFSLDIFKKFNSDYKNVEKQNYHLNYNTTRLIGCLEDFYHMFPNKTNLNLNESITYYFKLKEIKKTKILVIYVYYERKNETKNQTNLLYYLKYGLDNNSWSEYDITTLLIVNDNICELMIPEDENLIVLKRDHNGERDIGTYGIGIQFMENKIGKKIYNEFSHIMFLNSSVCGPFMDSNINCHWIESFLEKMDAEDSVICSPVINFLKEDDAGGPGPRCQTYCSLIKIDETIYNLLLNTKVSNLCPGTTNKDYKLEYGNVIKKHDSQHNIILIGEYGLTRVLLENDYKISCLLYDKIDYTNKNNWNNFSDRIDRSDDYKEEYLEKCIFIKNIWRINSELRNSYSVLSEKTNILINTKLNMKDIFEEENIKYDYKLLDISNKGSILNKSKVTSWDGKKDFYNKFGKAEEFILWPKQKNNNNAYAIYCHYDKDDIVKDYVIQGLKTLIVLRYDIIFCTTSKKIKNVDLPFKVNYFENTKLRDMKIWTDVLAKGFIKEYDWVLLINDSMLFPIHGINEMLNIIKEKRSKSDFWGLYLSNEGGRLEQNIEHLCSSFIEFNSASIKKLKEFYKENIYKCNSTEDVIDLIELKQTEFLLENNFKMETVISYKNLKQIENSIMFNPINTKKYIINKECFGIKWKYLGNYLNYGELDNKYLNYLLRYCKILKNRMIPNIPNYFREYSKELLDYKFYRNTYNDLYKLSKNELYEHFLEYGIYEKRIFNKDLIKNFDYKFYTNIYGDLKNLSYLSAVTHWHNYGYFEGRLGKPYKLDFKTNICIIIHLYNEELLDEFLEYIKNVETIFDKVTVIFTLKLETELDKKISDKYIIIKVENKGTDNYPFILCYEYINKNNINCDFILKLHSKISSNPTEDIIEWRKKLIEPITSLKNLIQIQYYFKTIKNLGHISSQECILPKNYDYDFPQNILGIKNLCEQFPHLEKEYTDFNGGNMFWISKIVLDKYLTKEFCGYIKDSFNENKPPSNIEDPGIYIEYLCERLFTGNFCYNSTNILVNSYQGTQRGIEVKYGKITNNYFYQPKVFSIYQPKLL